MLRVMRVVIALVFTAANTWVFFSLAVVGGLLLWPVRELPVFRRLWGLFQQIPRGWNLVEWHLVCRSVMGMKLSFEGDAPPPPKGGVRIFMSNHPTFVGFTGFGYVLTGILGDLPVLVMKKEVLRHPAVGFLAWPLRILDAGVFIDRRQRAAAFASIREAALRLGGQRTWVIFPDQRRPSRRRIREDREKFPLLAKKTFTQTLVPRSGGIMQLYEGLRRSGAYVQVINITLGFGIEDCGFRSVLDLVGATFHASCRDVSAEVVFLDSEETWRNWLVSLWTRKNHRLTEWKKPKSAPREEDEAA